MQVKIKKQEGTKMKNLIKNISQATLSELSTVFKKAVEEAYQAGRENAEQEAQLDEIEVGAIVKYLGGSKEYWFLISGENYRVLKRSIHPHENIPVLQIEDDREGDGYSLIRPDTVHLFEVVETLVIELQDSPPKTNNQKRSGLNQRAKEFVEEYEDDFHFEVDEEKRTVFAYSVFREEGRYNSVAGLAVCAPGDVFNADIGKAIALARALNINIPQEFLNAVQPDEVVVGMVTRTLVEGTEEETSKIRDVVSTEVKYIDGRNKVCPKFSNGFYASHFKIINDTNAVYGTGA